MPPPMLGISCFF